MADLPEDLKNAIAILTESDIEPPPKLDDGAEEPKRERKAREQRNAVIMATTTLLSHAFLLGTRIADALEKSNHDLIAMGEGTVVGELAKFEPVIQPELTGRLVVALEAIAAKLPPGQA